VTGLFFSDILPEDLGNAENGFKGFEYDPQTRLLTWDGARAGVPSLEPGQKMSLTYTVRLAAQHDEVSLIDSASLNADGLAEPLWAEIGLTLLVPQKQLTAVGAEGGKARGLNGKVEIVLPAKALKEPRGLLIQALNTEQLAEKNEPWLEFVLEMRVPQPEDAKALQERDRIVPMESVEAQFDRPVEITVSLDGTADLSALGADQTPFLATLDEASGTWVRMPLKTIDRESNTVTADLPHFSTWGVGIGSSFPTNSANILLFDNAFPTLFTGRSKYSIPLSIPAGRNGMQPDLSLSYSSGSVDGILGDVQAPWVGMGWNIDSVEIARKITNGACTPCGGGSYGYEDKFVLLFNGTGSELIADTTTPGRYRTKEDQYLYIQRHNDALGNGSAANATGEWWEVTEKDGTHWRLGWSANSEQLVAMKGYPGAASGSWATLGYAGHATDTVASRWRADSVADVYHNTMSFTYFEESRAVAGINYDRASYIDTISYTGHTSGTPAAGYSVVFVRESRGTDIPADQTQTDWDAWDTYRLDRIEVKYGSTTVRTYDLGYTNDQHTDGGVTWDTTTLTSLASSGSGTAAPTISFSYTDKDNRAAYGSNSNEWAYPRLAAISNGWGSTATYTYANDGRNYTSWYNWNVSTFDVTDSVSSNPARTTFVYSTPCYNDATAGWCNASNIGELIGYAQTVATYLAFDLTTVREKIIHKFSTIDEYTYSREYETQYQDPAGTTLRKTSTQWCYEITYGMWPDPFTAFNHPYSVTEYLLTGGSLAQASRTQYSYDRNTGNLLIKYEYNGSSLYRQTVYQYVTNTSPSVWILNTVSKQMVKDANGVILSEQDYGYNGSLPGTGFPTTNKPDLSRAVNGTQTIDTTYAYDSYGNLTETRLYKNYGTTTSSPSGSYVSYQTSYNDDTTTSEDDTLQIYPTSSTNPLAQTTHTHYAYGLGLPLTVTDPNNATTTMTYRWRWQSGEENQSRWDQNHLCWRSLRSEQKRLRHGNRHNDLLSRRRCNAGERHPVFYSKGPLGLCQRGHRCQREPGGRAAVLSVRGNTHGLRQHVH
jgi:hypothetical protein